MLGRIIAVYRAAFAGLPRDVWLLCFVLLINRAGSMVLPFLALFLTEARGMSVADAGKLVALYGIGSGIGSYVGGWLSDHLGTYRTLLLSLTLSGFGFLAFLALEGRLVLAVALFLLSLVAEALRPAAMAGIGERTPPELRIRSFALLRLAANLGMAIGPAIGGVLAVYDYELLFIGDALTCWMAAGLLVMLLGRKRDAAAEAQAAAVRRAAGSPWQDGPFLLLLILIVLLAGVIFQVFTTVPLFLRQTYGFRENVIGGLLALNALLIVLFEMVLIHWAQRHSKLVLTGIGCVLVCLGLALMPLGASIAFIAFTITVWTVGEMLSLPLTNALVAERASRGGLGRYMGLYTLAFSVAWVIAPLAGTHVMERYGPETLWYGVGALGPVMLGLALALIPAFRARAEA